MATSIKQHHSFDFHAKVSKKVAELTVVVHMLFKRNHEKEVEYEYFKIMVEKEFNKLKDEYRKKIEWLERQLDEQEAYRAKVEYELRDMRNLEERLALLSQQYDDTRQKLLEKEESLRATTFEMNVLKRKLQTFEGTSSSQYNKSEQDLTNTSTMVQPPVEQERVSKSAMQLHLPRLEPEDSSNESEATIKRLEDEMAKLRRDHDNELSKSYSENVLLQKKIDSYASSLSQEIDELKQTLNTLSTKQVIDQKKIAEIDNEKRRLEENLKKSEAEKRQLLRESKALRDQLTKAIKNNQLNKKNVADIKNPFTQSSQNDRIMLPRDQELERLQREVQMYRMELENREGNFNRMFADKQPVVLGPPPDNFLIERNLTGTRRKRRDHLPKLQDQRSLTFVNGFNQ